MKNSTSHRSTYVDAVKNSEKKKNVFPLKKSLFFIPKSMFFQMKNQRFHESMYIDDDLKNVKKIIDFSIKIYIFSFKITISIVSRI